MTLALSALLQVDLYPILSSSGHSCSALVNLPGYIRIQTTFLHKDMRDLVKYSLPNIFSLYACSVSLSKGEEIKINSHIVLITYAHLLSQVLVRKGKRSSLISDRRLQTLVHSFSNYLLRSYSKLNHVLRVQDTAVNKSDMVPALPRNVHYCLAALREAEGRAGV